MVDIQILTAYQNRNGENWPGVWVDYPPESGNDRTGVRPTIDPNTIVVECTYETAVLAQIAADPDYGMAAVLWQDDGVTGGNGPVDVPNTAEFAALRTKLALLSWRTDQIDEAVGVVVNGRTRAELAAAIVGWLRGRE